jgi:hypothetical protein
MVTGRCAYHAALAAGLAERGDGVVGTAELERPGSLQRLGLAHHGAASGCVKSRPCTRRWLWAVRPGWKLFAVPSVPGGPRRVVG